MDKNQSPLLYRPAHITETTKHKTSGNTPSNFSTTATQIAPKKTSIHCWLISLRPVLLCLIPLTWIIFSPGGYKVTFLQPGVSIVGAWVLLVPAVASAILILTRSVYCVYIARLLAFTQLGWLKVFVTEVRQATDVLLYVPEIVKISRKWNSAELAEYSINLFLSYGQRPNPAWVEAVLQGSGGSIIKTKELTMVRITKLLNPSFWDTSLAFVWSNITGIILTVIAGALVSRVLRFLFTPNMQTETLANTQDLKLLAADAKANLVQVNAIGGRVNEQHCSIVSLQGGLQTLRDQISESATICHQANIEAGVLLQSLSLDSRLLAKAVDKHTSILLAFDNMRPL